MWLDTEMAQGFEEPYAIDRARGAGDSDNYAVFWHFVFPARKSAPSIAVERCAHPINDIFRLAREF